MVVDEGNSGKSSKTLVVDRGRLVVGGWREAVDGEGMMWAEVFIVGSGMKIKWRTDEESWER